MKLIWSSSTLKPHLKLPYWAPPTTVEISWPVLQQSPQASTLKPFLAVSFFPTAWFISLFKSFQFFKIKRKLFCIPFLRNNPPWTGMAAPLMPQSRCEKTSNLLPSETSVKARPTSWSSKAQSAFLHPWHTGPSTAFLNSASNGVGGIDLNWGDSGGWWCRGQRRQGARGGFRWHWWWRRWAVNAHKASKRNLGTTIGKWWD